MIHVNVDEFEPSRLPEVAKSRINTVKADWYQPQKKKTYDTERNHRPRIPNGQKL